MLSKFLTWSVLVVYRRYFIFRDIELLKIDKISSINWIWYLFSEALQCTGAQRAVLSFLRIQNKKIVFHFKLNLVQLVFGLSWRFKFWWQPLILFVHYFRYLTFWTVKQQKRKKTEHRKKMDVIKQVPKSTYI